MLFLYQTEFLFFSVKWPDLPIFPVLDCPNPCPDPGQGHDYEVNSAGYWVVVESEVDQDVGVDGEIDDDAKNVHFEPEIANLRRVAYHDVVSRRHHPSDHAGKISRAKEQLKDQKQTFIND